MLNLVLYNVFWLLQFIHVTNTHNSVDLNQPILGWERFLIRDIILALLWQQSEMYPEWQPHWALKAGKYSWGLINISVTKLTCHCRRKWFIFSFSTQHVQLLPWHMPSISAQNNFIFSCGYWNSIYLCALGVYGLVGPLGLKKVQQRTSRHNSTTHSWCTAPSQFH